MVIPAEFWKRMKYVQRIHRFLYAVGLGPVIGKIILLLTTTGRKSRQKRVTPLQYEEMDGIYFIGSARGTMSDWYRNIQADCKVELRVKNLAIRGIAETSTDPERIADFLETRLKRHPFLMGLMMKIIHHLPARPSRKQLLELAASEAMVIIQPVDEF